MSSRTQPFNHCKPEYAIASVQRALTCDQITQRDADLIHGFIAETRATAGIGPSRINKLTFTLVGWRRYIGPFADLTITDLYTAFPAIEESNNTKGRPFKKNTVVDFKKILKQFFLWMAENGHTTIPQAKIEKLKTEGRDCMTKTASDLLTPEEVEKMISACKRDMDRALLMTLYEGAFRIGELGTMTWRQISFDKDGAVVNLKFKTDKERYVRLFMSAEYLARWRSSYPGDASGDNLVFVSKDGKPLNHGAILVQMKRIATRAGVAKHVTPHLFRHSRITHLVKEGMSESVIKMIGWGSVDTRMFKTYLHLAGKDIDAETKRFYGIQEPEAKKERRLEPRQCPHCHHIDSPIAQYCSLCGRSLSETAAVDQGDLINRLMADPDVLRQLADEIERRKGV
ncbi:MAG: site-specific integrase [Methanomicrobiales archaeon]|nr:site-specific integrase [Methanomicrobiales archaeon]